MQEKEIRWKTRLLLFSIYLCFFIFLTGCVSDKDSGVPEFKPDPDITPGDISDKLVARIYFDATLSMQGFVVPGSTDYTRICPYLESVIVSGWTDGKADFFRFGEQVERIDRNTYLSAGSADFYEDENIYRETFIQKIINYEDRFVSDQMEGGSTPEESTEIEGSSTPEESTEVVPSTEEVNARKEEENPLVIIVTDLFQDRGDINLLVAQLKEKYIKNRLEVGLFGLHSQFDGTVYDTGIGQAPLPYRSDPNDLKTFRPFYLLVLGRHADIAYYFDRLKANNPDAQTIIFSRYLVSPLLSFEDATTIELKKLNPLDQNPRLKRFRIVGDSDPAEISAKLKYVSLPHAMLFDSNAFEVSISAKDKRIGKTEENPEAAACMEVTSKLNEDGNELSVVFILDSEDLQRDTYLYEVTLSPDVDAYQAPKWCSDWDMGGERDGSKTLNLVNFVRDLSQVTARMHRPKIAQFHCYIGKR
jgi:hypothetical protein